MTATSSDNSFRQDINGLRAWAVIAVVLYHFEIPGFSGGFAGVDVFFVISGFLMTGIVTKGLEQQTFSLVNFYIARARRIWPALAAMCFVLLGLGWLLLLPPDYKTLSSHIVYSLAFASNIEYWLESGYFAAASHEKWLLHTWSLSVEWQFYLLLPFILLTTWNIKTGRNAQILVLSIGLIASFTASILITQTDQSGAFFLLHTRAWEMLAGGLVFLAAPLVKNHRDTKFWLEKTGLFLITLSIIVFNPETIWPGWLAVTPVLGAALVIIARHDSALTGSKLAQWIGDRSYSIYLWHWPACVTLTYFDIRDNSFALAMGLFSSIALGHFSYELVESKFRKQNIASPKKAAALGFGIACVTVAVLAVAVWGLNGVSGRFSPSIEVAAAEAESISPRRGECHPNKGPKSPACIHGTGDRRIILIGDSHANSMVAGLTTAANQHGFSVVEWTYSACNFVPGIRKMPSELAKLHKDHQCSTFINWVQAQLETVPHDIPVVIANRYAAEAFGGNETRHEKGAPGVYFSKPHETASPEFIREFSNHIIDSACQIAKKRTVFMIRPLPEMGFNVPKKLSRRMIFGTSQDLYIQLNDYKKRNDWVWTAQDVAKKRCGINIVDPTSKLCIEGRCYGSLGMRPMYHDDDHLSGFGNQIITPIFTDIFKISSPPNKYSNIFGEFLHKLPERLDPIPVAEPAVSIVRSGQGATRQAPTP